MKYMSKSSRNSKIVVFDLDETLGNFVELGMFWDALENYHGRRLSDNHFFEIVDMFPEYLRPDIIETIRFLIEKKRKGKCDSLMIYTNNQGPKSWARMISKYFDYKLEAKAFDRIIAAFKVNGKKVELCRTSNEKSVDDLFKCTKVRKNTEICFLDDQYHPLMSNEKVFYINLKPYFHSVPFKTMAETYYNTSGRVDEDKDEFINTIEKYMNRFNYKLVEKDEADYAIDRIISKQIMIHLKEFFELGEIKQVTRKRRLIKKHRKTSKINNK